MSVHMDTRSPSHADSNRDREGDQDARGIVAGEQSRAVPVMVDVAGGTGGNGSGVGKVGVGQGSEVSMLTSAFYARLAQKAREAGDREPGNSMSPAIRVPSTAPLQAPRDVGARTSMRQAMGKGRGREGTEGGSNSSVMTRGRTRGSRGAIVAIHRDHQGPTMPTSP